MIENIKIGIHHNENSFSNRWIKYCEENKISYKVVNCLQDNIIEQLKDCNALMWHFMHFDYQEYLIANNLVQNLESMGKIIFPNYSSCWHYDNKIAQKYLLESIDAPLVPTDVFFSMG